MKRTKWMPWMMIISVSFLLGACGANLNGKSSSSSSGAASLSTGTSVTTDPTASTPTDSTPSQLTVLPSTASVQAKATLKIQVSGGKAPYTFAVVEGAIDAIIGADGTFVAPSAVQVVKILVKDSSQAQLSVMVTLNVTAVVETPTVIDGKTCFNTAATGTGAVQLSCDVKQSLKLGMASCESGGIPIQAKLGDLGAIASCLNDEKVGSAVSCCADKVLAAGTVYKRMVWTNSVKSAGVFCQKNEKATPIVGVCNLKLVTPTAVLAADGRPGLEISCGGTNFSSLGAYCEGVVP